MIQQEAKPKDGIDFRRCRPVGGAYHGIRP
jgi:hypothetical protein